MRFGASDHFWIEAFHEPAGYQWRGFGRMAVHFGTLQIGDLEEFHCSLHHAADRFRELAQNLQTLWDSKFDGLSHNEIFLLLDDACYSGESSEFSAHLHRHDFLTNTGEQFDDAKTFILCTPDQSVLVLCAKRDGTRCVATCELHTFKSAAMEFVGWLETQIATMSSPPFHPFC